MGKTGLVVEGGGMKCAYSAGILDEFLDQGITFDYCSGVSAGSANVASYLGGQKVRNLRFYTEHIHDPQYFGKGALKDSGNLFNLEYIYRTLSNSDGKDPIDWEALVRNPAEYEIVATDAETGLPHYFDGKTMPKDDYSMIMASCALPAVCHPVTVGGRKYFDGGVSDSIPVKRAFERGCRRVVVITSKPWDFVKGPEGHRAFYTVACWRYPNVVRDLNNRHHVYRHSQGLMYRLEEMGKVFVFAPSEHLPMSTYAMNEEENQALYDLGIKDFNTRKEELTEFLKQA